MKQTLQEIFNEIGNLTDQDFGGNDKGGKIHTYLKTYDKLFEPFRNDAVLLEIGLATGDSIKLWDRYFKWSFIFGVDISIVFDKSLYEKGWLQTHENIVSIIEADATKPDFLKQIEDVTFSIVIDDGSHVTADQIAAFNLLKDKMKKGSLYILEDILALDIEREKYLALHDNCEIIDMRSNGRFDNVLIIYHF